ncbi:hypothetical protein WICMUC_004377 [Wickerhamomyces mucosus]|uniref:Restriction of telomere capping protein 5 n=1 Tax=Wickerhamomyces mucosus TaxID=1378264 RepID=A0A9P8PJ82_9ASCO|nr:hypothetical protein WICMUC_004377 [Wickerhamomyces mucosus]
MGQSSSLEDHRDSAKRIISTDHLIAEFYETCVKQYQTIEMISFKANLKKFNKDLSSSVDINEFISLLGIPEDKPQLADVLFRLVRALSRFPNISNFHSDIISIDGLIIAMTLLNQERYHRILTKEYDYKKLIFIALLGKSNEKSKMNDSVLETAYLDGYHNISWSNMPQVKQTFSRNEETIEASASDILYLISFLLTITRLDPTKSLKSFSKEFNELNRYKLHSLSILKAMNSSIRHDNIKTSTVSYRQFSEVIDRTAPNLLKPLSYFLDTLLFQFQDDSFKKVLNEKENEQYTKKIEKNENHTESASKMTDIEKKIDTCTLAQISTFLKHEIIYSSLRKLYIGSESGFSMRSLESKVFKWNAPTIILIKGSRISTNITNPRYKSLEEDYPKFNQPRLQSQSDSDKIVYGVYIDQPWRITNKDYFGTENTLMFQLFPVQKVFKPTINAKNLIYFNTLGGGIGFGNNQPYLKNNTKKYYPGNVSLTIESALEFAIFRNLGLGGSYRNLGVEELNTEYEDRFLIRDVEVWGCGGTKEIEEQNKRWEWEQNEAKRRQAINLKSLGEDRAILEMAGIIGQYSQSGGSI